MGVYAFMHTHTHTHIHTRARAHTHRFHTLDASIKGRGKGRGKTKLKLKLKGETDKEKENDDPLATNTHLDLDQLERAYETERQLWIDEIVTACESVSSEGTPGGARPPDRHDPDPRVEVGLLAKFWCVCVCARV